MTKLNTWAESHQDSRWVGQSELWADPLGNTAEVSKGTLQIDGNGLRYNWSYKETQQSGQLKWANEQLNWQDSWHQPEGVMLTPVPGHGSLLAGEYSYPAGSGPDWHWRIKLALRPNDTLVLQMSNIAPWGEEARAVRMTFQKSD
ncbi:MAG: hypothetical protein V2J20_08955 [Wenzhouxiangella sp.]|jgi:hypothetical protein|nr:hypothetical protein [Wenzhouxiangella sp.]